MVNKKAEKYDYKSISYKIRVRKKLSTKKPLLFAMAIKKDQMQLSSLKTLFQCDYEDDQSLLA